MALSLTSNFAAGTVGSALEQVLSTGTADIRESVTSGLINAASAAVYGNGPLLSAKDAIVKGAKSGAVSAGIGYLSNAWNTRDIAQNRNVGGINPSSLISQRGSNKGCQKTNPFNGELGYASDEGYSYGNTGSRQSDQSSFSFVDLTKDIVKGAVVGGLASLLFYGLDQVISSPKNSIGSTRATVTSRNKGVSETKTLYRGERSTVTPDNVFTNGISAKGTHNDALLHTQSNTTAGNFVSTTSDKSIATEFAGKNGYVYKIKTKNYVDINSTYGNKVPFPEQKEFAIPGGIHASEVQGAYKKQKGTLIEEMISNSLFGGK